MLYDTATFQSLTAAYNLDNRNTNALLLSASERLSQRPYDVVLARLFATICAKLRIRNDE